MTTGWFCWRQIATFRSTSGMAVTPSRCVHGAEEGGRSEDAAHPMRSLGLARVPEVQGSFRASEKANYTPVIFRSGRCPEYRKGKRPWERRQCSRGVRHCDQQRPRVPICAPTCPANGWRSDQNAFSCRFWGSCGRHKTIEDPSGRSVH